MTRNGERTCRLLALILLLYVALAAWYSLTIPLGEAPDEVPHFTYIRYLAQHGRLPTTTEEHEAFQPPLYYVLGAVLTAPIQDEAASPFAVQANAHFDVSDPRAPKNLLLHSAVEDWPYRGWVLAWHLVRLLSIALGAVTVWATYHLGRAVLPDQPLIALTMAALTAFTPQFLFMSAVVNNDNAATAFSALILWQMAALLRSPSRPQIWKRSALLGLLLGLGLLSKASVGALLPVVPLAVTIASLQAGASSRQERARLLVGALLLVLGLGALISGWYFWRNWLLHGDPLGTSFLLQINARREGPLTPEVLAWLSKGLFRSFWLGWIGISFEDGIYWLIGLACLVGGSGFVAWLLRRWRTLDVATRWTLGLLGLHAVLTVAALLQWTATVLGTDQGRLIYPLLPTVMLVLASGWAWWAPGKSRPWVLGGLAVGLFCLAVLTPIRYIKPLYAPAPVATEEELAAATPLDVDWDGIRLLGYRLESDQVQPGGKLVLCLYWQTLEPQDRQVWALIQLVDEEGRFLMYLDGSPTAGRDTTDRWTPGQPLASCHLLPVPEYGAPGDYHITISLHPPGEQRWLPATGPEGTPLGERLILPPTVRITAP